MRGGGGARLRSASATSKVRLHRGSRSGKYGRRCGGRKPGRIVPELASVSRDKEMIGTTKRRGEGEKKKTKGDQGGAKWDAAIVISGPPRPSKSESAILRILSRLKEGSGEEPTRTASFFQGAKRLPHAMLKKGKAFKFLFERVAENGSNRIIDVDEFPKGSLS